VAASTRERLIEAGAELFYQSGFQSVGLDQILDRVGITKTAFYKHFESKDDLIIAVLEVRDGQDMQTILSYMRERGGDDPRAQILALFDHLDEWFREPGFRGCLFMNAATEFASASHPIHLAAAAHGDHLAAVLLGLAVRMKARSPETITRQLMLLFGGAIASRHVSGDIEAARTARETAEALLGVGAMV
jgi:AcrR family transcriptional regulator